MNISNEFGWDNEFTTSTELITVPSFKMKKSPVTNLEYLEFIEANGYNESKYWKDDDWVWVQQQNINCPIFWNYNENTKKWIIRVGNFHHISLTKAKYWPVNVTQAEASAYCKWKGGRLPLEEEWMIGAYQKPKKENLCQLVNTCSDSYENQANVNWQCIHPTDVGAFPDGNSYWGFTDMIGNGWEWTSSYFLPYPGFEASKSYPLYSVDFFDKNHYVLKGGSFATDKLLLSRNSFRNFFQPHYKYVFTQFRVLTPEIIDPFSERYLSDKLQHDK